MHDMINLALNSLNVLIIVNTVFHHIWWPFFFFAAIYHLYFHVADIALLSVNSISP